MPPPRCTLPDVKLADVKLAATTTRCILPDAKLAVTTPRCHHPTTIPWPFASSRWPFHDNQRTKTPILCSKCLKTRVPNLKSAQKPRFCARNARKRGFRTPKAHKNRDFVLEKPKNGGPEGRKRTKTPILCSKCPKTRVPDPKSAQKPQFCAREDRDWHREERKLASEP